MRILLFCNIKPSPTPWLSIALQNKGHSIDLAENSQYVRESLALECYDFIMFDLSPANGQGWNGELWSALEACRTDGEVAPILVVLAQDDCGHLRQLLDNGVDDFLLRPFNAEELEARIRSLIKRGKSNISNIQQVGLLKFDSVSGIALVDERKLELTARETGVLEILFRFRGRIVSKEQIASAIFSFDDDADLSSIRVYVHRIRRKISHSGVTIRVVRGMGYVLEELA